MNRRTRIAAHVLPLALAACATTSPAVRTKTVEVKVPVAVQPITPAQVPPPPKPLPPRPATLPQAADVLLSRWCEAVAYVLKSDPLLRISAGLPAGTVPAYPECEGKR